MECRWATQKIISPHVLVVTPKAIAGEGKNGFDVKIVL